jgi:hypothetical protein
MTAIKGVWGAVDSSAVAWRNDIEDYRALAWEAFHQSQGVLRGFTMTLDVGSLSVTFAPGAAIIEQRGTDINGDGRGYFVYNDVNTTVAFGTPSAASRNDAVVFAWGDPQYGALGASATPPGGPMIVVVPGVSGSTVPRTDAQIQTAIGVGGWFRFADVIIAPGNTSVQAGNVTSANVDATDYVGSTRFIYKSANEIVNNSTTLQDDDALFFTGKANAVYIVSCDLMWGQAGGSASAMDAKVGFGVPSGNWDMGVHASDQAIAAASSVAQLEALAQVGAVAASITIGIHNSNNSYARVFGRINMGATGGKVALRWAQNGLVAFDLTLRAGSVMTVRRVA